jgi:deoxyribodipyrimidine photo-lyase
MPSRAVVWFRRDLRVADHPALLAALDAADQVVPVFVVDRALLDGRPSGPNRRAFLHGALQALANELGSLGGRLLVLEGDPVALLPRLAREFAADAVYCSREHTPTPAAATPRSSGPCAPTAAPATPCTAAT